MIFTNCLKRKSLDFLLTSNFIARRHGILRVPALTSLTVVKFRLTDQEQYIDYNCMKERNVVITLSHKSLCHLLEVYLFLSKECRVLSSERSRSGREFVVKVFCFSNSWCIDLFNPCVLSLNLNSRVDWRGLLKDSFVKLDMVRRGRCSVGRSRGTDFCSCLCFFTFFTAFP